MFVSRVEVRQGRQPARSHEGGGDEVKFQVALEQSQAGDGRSVELDNSCSPVLGRSVKKAVKWASPFPGPPDASVFQRTIVFSLDSSER